MWTYHFGAQHSAHCVHIIIPHGLSSSLECQVLKASFFFFWILFRSSLSSVDILLGFEDVQNSFAVPGICT